MKTINNIESCHVDTKELLLKWSEVPWDMEVFGSSVLQVEEINVRGKFPDKDMNKFIMYCINSGVELISARLPHDSIEESMLLEKHEFRFIEMVYQPTHNNIHLIEGINNHGLTVGFASGDDIPHILNITESAFINERFYIDPRIPNELSNVRFKNWVTNSVNDDKQKLYVIKDAESLIAFFIIELLDDKLCYWHLNAVSPKFQGKGFGRRAWLAMIQKAIQLNCDKIKTCIAVRNYKVLNLYASLNFSFDSPKMTFHWVKNK